MTAEGPAPGTGASLADDSESTPGRSPREAVVEDVPCPSRSSRTAWRVFPDHPDVGWTPWAYLVYSVFLLMGPLFAGVGLAGAWPELLAFAVFLPLYRQAWWTRGKGMLPILGAFVLLGLVLAPRNPASCNFFIYAAAFTPNLGSSRRARLALLALVAIQALASWILALSAFFWAVGIVFTILIGGLCIHQREIFEANERLRISREETAHLARVAERERIARDLHDLLGHTLSLVAIKSELAARVAAKDPGRAVAEIRDVERISRDALAQVRAAVAGVRSRSFAGELEQASAALAAAGVELESDIEEVEPDPALEGVLALVLREAVTNVMRHAAARTCRVTLRRDRSEILLEVSDDGRGARGPEGSGLRGIRERISEIGGSVERAVADGTRLVVRLPAG